MQIDTPEKDCNTQESIDSNDVRSPDQQLSAASVKSYLKNNPDFFEKFPEALGDLQLPDIHGNQRLGALNLKQLSVLRKREGQSREKLEELLDIASENEALFAKTREFTLELLECANTESILARASELFCSLFHVEHSVFKILDSDELSVEDFIVESGSSEACFCGAIREHESELIFERADIASCVALIRPLARNEGEKLLIAAGSHDIDFYYQSIGTDFINFLADYTQKAIDHRGEP